MTESNEEALMRLRMEAAAHAVAWVAARCAGRSTDGMPYPVWWRVVDLCGKPHICGVPMYEIPGVRERVARVATDDEVAADPRGRSAFAARTR